MVSVISGKRQLGSRDCSLVLSAPKCKLRKVSAVRDFPFGCGPNATPTHEYAKEAGSGGQKSSGNLFKDERTADKGGSSYDVEGKGFFVEVVESESHDAAVCLRSSGKATCGLVKCDVVEHGSDESQRLPLDIKYSGLPNVLIVDNSKSSNVTDKMEESISRDEYHDNKDLPEARFESLSTLKNIGIIDLAKAYNDSKSEMAGGSGLPLCLLSHHPCPSCLVGREKKYPPRRTVSAVRDFPAGCGCNVQQLCEAEDKHLSQDGDNTITRKGFVRNDQHNAGVDFVVDIVSRDKAKGAISGNIKAKCDGQSDKGACRVMIMPSSQCGKQSEMKGNVQHGGLMGSAGCNGNDEKDEGCNERHGGLMGSAGLNKDMVYKKVEHNRGTSIVSCSDIGLEEEKTLSLQSREKRAIVLCLMSEPNCPWKRRKERVKSSSSSANAKRNKGKKPCLAEQDKFKCSPDKKEVSVMNLGESSKAITPCYPNETDTDEFLSISMAEVDSSEDEGSSNDFLLVPRKCDFDVSLPPFGSVFSSERGIRSKVRETLRLFHAIVRKLQQGEETKLKDKEYAISRIRIDLYAAKILKNCDKYVNFCKKGILGPVPGVEVGDVFHFRVELSIIGLHRPLKSGIEYLNLGHKTIATSIVASGGDGNDIDSSDVLIYTVQGGNARGDKEPEDQKLERGNVALKNSIDEKNLVRVIRWFKEKKPADTDDARPKMVATYAYDGLYTVEKYWHDIEPNGKLVYKFQLRRHPCQPELAWKEVTRSKNYTARNGRCVDDISGGRETVPICAINTLDDEKPPLFTYITSMIYPDWCQPLPPRGCDCKDGCSDSEHCACAIKNGGEIPYNYDGAIVEAKPLVYECGPSCKCPPTCHNRVSQYGIKFPLEIFKTESTGWGVRCLSLIPSGSFICEYIGELLDDKEAEQRAGSDEYLFDIGQNYNDPTLWDGLSSFTIDEPSSSSDFVENVGFTIDAAKYGNIGRFFNHSCSPNLYAQNVLYDHEDRRIPHIMLFAAENIPPLQELTYHYNYSIDQVFDSDGNVKRKSCHCGSAECTGRMY